MDNLEDTLIDKKELIMKNILQQYLDQNNVTRYQIYKATGIAQTTLQSAVAPTKPLSGQTVKVISAVAEALGKTPGEVLDELIDLEKESHSNEEPN